MNPQGQQLNAQVNITLNQGAAAQTVQGINTVKNAVNQFAGAVGNANAAVGTGGGQGGAGGGAAGNAGGMGGAVRTVPSFLQFSLFPMAGLARQLGAGGLANALYGAGNIAGIGDAVSVIPAQIATLSTSLQSMGGILGKVATGAAALAAPLGATAAGLASVLVVAVPIALVVGGLAIALAKMSEELEKSKKAAEDYTAAQVKVGELAYGGATTDDVNKQIADTQSKIDARQNVMNQYQGYLDEQQSLFDEAGKIGWNGETDSEQLQAYQELRARYDAFHERIATETNGLITDIGQLPGLIEQYRQELQPLNTLLLSQKGLLGSDQIEANNAAELARQEAKFRQQRIEAIIQTETQVTSLTTQQIQERIAANRSEAAAIHANYGLMSEDEQKLADKRLQLLADVFNVYDNALPTSGVEVLNQNAAAFEKFFAQIKQLAEDFALQTSRLLEERMIASREEAEDWSLRRYREERDRREQEERQALEDRRREERQGTEEVRIQEDIADRIRRIMENLQDELDEAVGARDANAYRQAVKRANRQLQQDSEDDAKSRRRRAEDVATDERYRREDRAATMRAYQTRLRDEDQDRQIRLNRLNEHQQREDRIRTEDYNRRVWALTKQVADETGMWYVLATNVGISLNNIRNALSGFFSFLEGSANNLSHGGGSGGGGIGVGFSTYIDNRVTEKMYGIYRSAGLVR